MDTVENVLTVVWALRWVTVLVVMLALGALYADALGELKKKRERVQYLEDANRRLILQLEHRRKRPIIAGRVIR